MLMPLGVWRGGSGRLQQRHQQHDQQDLQDQQDHHKQAEQGEQQQKEHSDRSHAPVPHEADAVKENEGSAGCFEGADATAALLRKKQQELIQQQHKLAEMMVRSCGRRAARRQ